MNNQRHLIFDSILLGVIGAFAARIFDFLLRVIQRISLSDIAGYVAPGLPNEGGSLIQVIGHQGLWLIPIVTVLGGLISGILVYSLAPEAEGHGTDTAVKAFHRNDGYIRKRVTPLKLVASAITIGTGGSAGREGPTALFSAGIGSMYATWSNRTDRERRLLVLVGMAAGLSAIFRSPIGTAIFAVEVLYSDIEFDAEALLYTMLGSVIAYTVNGIFVGWKPLFQVPQGLEIDRFTSYGWYAILGIVSGGIGVLLPNVFYGTRDLFHKIPIPPHFKPAIGALGVGLLALELPQVLGGGYGWIQHAMNGDLTLWLLFGLIFGKMVAFSLTVSSGGSGGVFAPSLYVGAMVGGFLSHLFHQPHAAFVIVGMAAVFGSAARVPLATLLMVTEMTGGYHLLTAAALAVFLASFIQTSLSSRLKYKSLYEAQVVRRIDSPAHQMEHIRTALTVLKEHRELDIESIGHLDLLALLESGIPIDFPEGMRLSLRKIPETSPLVGRTVEEAARFGSDESLEIIAILRERQLVLSHPGARMKAGDELLILGTPGALNAVERHLV